MLYLVLICLGLIVGKISLMIFMRVWTPVRAKREEQKLLNARKIFHIRREQLEAKFLDRAGSVGKPRGLRWVDVDFEDDVTYARDKRSGQLSAFVGVTISFEAIVGGGMEDVEAVSNLRAATAVFRLDEKGNWTTDGRAIFNLNPDEAVQFYQANLELIAKEEAVAHF